MSNTEKLVRFYKRWRGRYRRMERIIFMSPAEARFVELMGGHILRPSIFGWQPINKNGFPLCIVFSLGTVLRGEGFKREVRYGKYFVDFANDLNRIIEIDGSQYHQDVVADMDREIYIKEWCWRKDHDRQARIMRIPAFRLTLDPERVQSDVLNFMQE